MDAGTITRLRSGTQQFIIRRYGPKSHFYTDYSRIDNYISQYTINEVKGLLLAIKDDILFELSQNSLNGSSSEKNNKKEQDKTKLTGLLLSLFYKHGIYNWDAIKNLILSDSDYYDYTIKDAEAIYQKFMERKIIARMGLGEAYCITEEGKKFYEKTFNGNIATIMQEKSPTLPSDPAPINYPMVKKANFLEMIEVFLSYSWDTPEFQSEVAAFVNSCVKMGTRQKWT
jgi:hypothetical protein